MNDLDVVLDDLNTLCHGLLREPPTAWERLIRLRERVCKDVIYYCNTRNSAGSIKLEFHTRGG